MARVITFELVARAGLVERFERILNVGESVPEDHVARAFQHCRFPFVLEVFETLEHRKQAEVH
jgi:hypothetical protein